MRVLYTGGARSGKSARAQAVAERLGPRRLFIATAEGLDDDMRARIRRHQQDRGPGWVTVEEPLDPAAVITREAAHHDVLLLDCLTLWVSNLLCKDVAATAFDAAVAGLVTAVQACPVPLLLVTNEVGLGIVPADAFTRCYRDMLGRTNQALAAACDAVVLMISGLSLPVKGVEP